MILFIEGGTLRSQNSSAFKHVIFVYILQDRKHICKKSNQREYKTKKVYIYIYIYILRERE